MTCRRALLLIFLLALITVQSVAAQVPELIVEAPQNLAGVAARIRALDPKHLEDASRLAGLFRAGPPIRVILAEEGSPLAQSAPPWVSGFADPNAGVVVLMPARAPSFPDSSLEDLLRHEVAHVLIGRAAGGRPVPRWFQEGLAMIAGQSWGLADRSQLTIALFADRRISLTELDSRFAADQGTVQRAYAVAGAFVRDLVQSHGRGVTGAILSGVAEGLPFDEAFQRAAGVSLSAAAESFWERQTFWYRWVPLLTSSVFLWILITLLALWAIRSRRTRDAAQRRIWDEEEARRLAPPAVPQPPDEWVN
jgi:hypothetical protein